MSMFVILCIAALFIQLGFLVLFWISKNFVDLISFGLCISAILVPVVFESFGLEEHFSKYIMFIFLLLIVSLSAHQFLNYLKIKEMVVLVRSVNLFVVACLYMVLYFYAELLNTA